MYRNYTDEDIIEAVLCSKTVAEICRRLGIKPVGGNYGTIKRHVVRLGLDTSHLIGQAWSKNLNLAMAPKTSASIKKRVVDLQGYECDLCGIDSWLGEHLTLELDHINGDNTNNEMSNLRLLCPNCHSQTPTFRNRKR